MSEPVEVKDLPTVWISDEFTWESWSWLREAKKIEWRWKTYEWIFDRWVYRYDC